MRSAGFLQTEEGGKPQKEREDIWSVIERLLVAAGARRLDGAGTRVHFERMARSKPFTALTPGKRPSATKFVRPAHLWKGSGARHDEHHELQGLPGPSRL